MPIRVFILIRGGLGEYFRVGQLAMQLGANVKRRKFNLRPGLLLSYGASNKYMQAINFDNPKDTNLLVGEPHMGACASFCRRADVRIHS